jgi:hypothetical protein
VDAITVRIDPDGKAHIYLNDFTTPTLPKGKKASHRAWRKALNEAVKEENLKFGDPNVDAAFKEAVEAAIKARRVYDRPVRVDPSKVGADRVEVGKPRRR